MPFGSQLSGGRGVRGRSIKRDEFVLSKRHQNEPGRRRVIAESNGGGGDRGCNAVHADRGVKKVGVYLRRVRKELKNIIEFTQHRETQAPTRELKALTGKCARTWEKSGENQCFGRKYSRNSRYSSRERKKDGPVSALHNCETGTAKWGQPEGKGS